MAVIECALDRTNRKAQLDELNIGTYTLRYQVLTDSVMGAQGVYAGAISSSPHPLPVQWSTFSYQSDSDSLSFARDYDFDGDPQNLKRWWVTVTWSPLGKGENSDSTGTSPSPIMAEPTPVLRQPVIWWDREVTTEHVTKDYTHKDIVNKVKDLYPDDIEIERPRGIMVVEFNVATLREVIYYCRRFDGAVNSVAWTMHGKANPPIPKRAALCREVSSGSIQSEHGYTFYHLVFRFVFAEEEGSEKPEYATWDYPLFERGYMHWTKKAGEYEETLPGMRKRTFSQSLVSLNADGTRRPDDQDSIVTLWRIRREVDFNELPI